MSKSEETSIVRWLVETALLVLLAFGIAQGVKSFIIQPFVVPTPSMVPTIQVGNYFFAEKLTYRFLHGPERGDIVVFDDPSDDHPQLVKRVIGLPGETVEIKDEQVYIDGEPLDEPYVYGKPTIGGTVITPIVIPDGQIWLMGDNRPNSGDSRYFGPQKIENIRGRAFFTYWPLSEIGEMK